MKPSFEKYIPFKQINLPDRQWPNNTITKAPIWCSVDLRDGNQALVDPMNLEEKLEFFHALCDMGFKEIEIGFPSASETEYEICRELIENNHIPDDVTIQVLVQAREHLIRKTFEAVKGAKNVIVHFYNSTSTLQRKVVFKTDMDGVIKIAVDGAKLIKQLTDEYDGDTNFRFEYSPESFSGTEPENAVEICDRVIEALGSTAENKLIVNLPNTVEMCTPNTYADQIEYFARNLKHRDAAIISIHPHNDRGCGVATAEMGILAGADRIFKLLDEKPEVDDGYVTLVNVRKEGDRLVETEKKTGMWAWKYTHSITGETEYRELKGALVMDDVDFGYTDDKIVLHNIDLYAEPGQKIAFVGSTGAGKTTITNLINRFYDIQDGKIRYDDINVNKIKKADLRRSLGIVLQDTHLFTGTVMENIRYGRLDATDEEVKAAARAVHADEVAEKLDKGYDSDVGEGGDRLSTGEKQLLSFARAVLADPAIFVLDEATSSIDTKTEQLIQQATDKLLKGRTSFLIAHRLSTIRNADLILVVRDGKIVEQGRHLELLEKKGYYYQLVRQQFADEESRKVLR